MVTAQLHHFVRAYTATVTGELLGALDQLADAVVPLSTLPDKPHKQYERIAAFAPRLMAEMHETVWRCGAAQLLRAHVGAALGGLTRIDCSLLHTVLATADAALLAHLRHDQHTRATAEANRRRQAAGGDDAGGADGSAVTSTPLGGSLLSEPTPVTDSSEAAADLSPYLDAAGITSPKEQVLVVAPLLPRLPLALAIFTHMQLQKVAWSPQLAALTEPKGRLTDESIDGVALVVGVACVLRQFHPNTATQYVEYLTQLLRALLHTAFTGASSAKVAEPPAEACTLVQYLELFSRHTAIDVPGLHLYQSAVGSMN